MKIKPGYCSCCDKIQIWHKDASGRIVLTDQYAEFALALSDDTVARHAICNDCIVKLTDKKVEKILERIKATWREEMVGWATDRQFDNIDTIVLAGWDNSGTSDKKVQQKLKAYKEKQHADRIKKSKKKD